MDFPVIHTPAPTIPSQTISCTQRTIAEAIRLSEAGIDGGAGGSGLAFDP